MKSSTLISIIIIIVIIFGTITFYKLEKFPTGDCCKDISNSESNICKKCDDYNLIDKIIYVWKFS